MSKTVDFALTTLNNLPLSLRRPLVQAAFSSLRRDISSIQNNQEAIEFAFNSTYFSEQLFRPLQERNEILGLLDLLERDRPKVVVEIGTNSGGTLLLFCQVADSSATIVSIDIPWGKREFIGGYPPWKVPLFEMFRREGQDIHLVRANSQLSATVDELKEILGSRKIDFLFIDADHSYKGVSKDFALYSPLVRKGGVIAFHDILKTYIDPSKGNPCEVDLFWNEIKSRFNYTEIINDPNQGWAGIGVLHV